MNCDNLSHSCGNQNGLLSRSIYKILLEREIIRISENKTYSSESRASLLNEQTGKKLRQSLKKAAN